MSCETSFEKLGSFIYFESVDHDLAVLLPFDFTAANFYIIYKQPSVMLGNQNVSNLY